VGRGIMINPSQTAQLFAQPLDVRSQSHDQRFEFFTREFFHVATTLPEFEGLREQSSKFGGLGNTLHANRESRFA